MRKYMKVIIVSILIGITLAYLFYNNIRKEVKVFSDTTDRIYILQAGVFKNKDNAYNYAKSFNSKIIYYDDEYYRVFIGVATDTQTLNILEQYYKDNAINYFVKQMNVNNIASELTNYEKVLNNTNESLVFDKLNQEMLDILLTYLS